jgi:hypothetical protein
MYIECQSTGNSGDVAFLWLFKSFLKKGDAFPEKS